MNVYLPGRSAGCVFVLVVVSFFSCTSQNLVINPGFEKFHCSRWYNSSIENCAGWSSPNLQSPDYFINDCPGYITSVFPDKTWWGSQLPAGGKAYAGIIACRPNKQEAGKTLCEYLQGSLQQPLKAGRSYVFQLSLSLSESSALSLQTLGVYFSDKKTDTRRLDPLGYKPQLILKLVNDTCRWILIKQEFIAAGDEAFFSIGCFEDPARLKTLRTKPAARVTVRKEAYYFIDNVAVVEEEASGETPGVSDTSTHELSLPAAAPPPVPFDAKPGRPFVLNHVFFESGKSTLLAASFKELEALKIYLQDHPGQEVEISGYTDNAGDPESNLVLSESRAKAVGNYLLEKGIEPSRITMQGFGSAAPVADNATGTGRALNRRVVIRLVIKNPGASP